jgi:cation transport ATPase
MSYQPSKTLLFVNGLGCGGGSARTAEAVLRAIPGVRRAYVNSLTETAYVEHNPAACRPEQLEARLRAAGFGAVHSR